jgi:hypothetical protein
MSAASGADPGLARALEELVAALRDNTNAEKDSVTEQQRGAPSAPGGGLPSAPAATPGAPGGMLGLAALAGGTAGASILGAARGLLPGIGVATLAQGAAAGFESGERLGEPWAAGAADWGTRLFESAPLVGQRMRDLREPVRAGGARTLGVTGDLARYGVPVPDSLREELMGAFTAQEQRAKGEEIEIAKLVAWGQREVLLREMDTGTTMLARAMRGLRSAGDALGATAQR